MHLVYLGRIPQLLSRVCGGYNLGGRTEGIFQNDDALFYYTFVVMLLLNFCQIGGDTSCTLLSRVPVRVALGRKFINIWYRYAGSYAYLHVSVHFSR